MVGLVRALSGRFWGQGLKVASSYLGNKGGSTSIYPASRPAVLPSGPGRIGGK